MSEIQVTTKRLGRLFVPDERDEKFLMSSILPKEASKREKRFWWANGWWGDQLETPQCVAYGWLHWLEDGPVPVKGPAPKIPPLELYNECQKLDHYPGENYDGSSTRAGAKALMGRGFIKEYRWAWDLPTLTEAVLEIGPVVIGTNWTESMFKPDKKHFIEYKGPSMGGHLTVVNGINKKAGYARIKNSWGKDWAKNGHVYIRLEDLEKLIMAHGEACIAIPA